MCQTDRQAGRQAGRQAHRGVRGGGGGVVAKWPVVRQIKLLPVLAMI